MTEIPISEIRGIRIGQVENTDAGTGCTVLICEDGMRAGVDIRGGGPASRETPLLNPLMAAQIIHAIVLGGGSAFGLGAANGVMKYLEERKIGFDVGVTKVPLVVQSDIFDLTVGDPFTRPDAAMGYEAAKAAMEASNYRDGNYGVGCGALTVLIRYFGSYPEGVTYSILIMNICTWAIDKAFRRHQFGVTKEDIAAEKAAKKAAKEAAK